MDTFFDRLGGLIAALPAALDDLGAGAWEFAWSVLTVLLDWAALIIVAYVLYRLFKAALRPPFQLSRVVGFCWLSVVLTHIVWLVFDHAFLYAVPALATTGAALATTAWLLAAGVLGRR